MKRYKLTILITFSLGVVLTLVGFLLKGLNVQGYEIILKTGFVVDILFVLLLIYIVIKTLVSNE